MNIEFNPGRPTQPGSSESVNRRAPAAGSAATAQFESIRSLEVKLGELPSTRPEQVDRARHLLQDVQYPPAETMDRIASLLAMHIRSL